MVIAFFGHSSFVVKKEYEQRVEEFLEKTVGDHHADMYLGGYGGFDSFAYDCCKKYKQTHPNVSLVFITPYITVEYQKNHLNQLKSLYDLIIYPEIENRLPRFAIVYRNKWIVENADYIVVGIDHVYGGAYKAYCHALNIKKPVINIMEKHLE